jgi:tetratricopeptide (TPR) repeat protein
MGKRQRDRKAAAKAKIEIQSEYPDSANVASTWPGEGSRYLVLVGISVIALSIVGIYWQTVSVLAIDYEDPFYLVHSPYIHVSAPFSRLGAVWSEPYFANFHPVTTTTWLFDRALADATKYFDAVPFRIAHLIYAALGASLLIPLYRRLGVPTLLAAIGAVVYAVHPIHTEVIAWLSARKDLVSFIFIVMALLAWLWARDAAAPNQWKVRYAAAILMTLLAVLAKPVAVIIPPLFIAYEFCAGPHAGIAQWRWSTRTEQPRLTRVMSMAAIFLTVGGGSSWIFRKLLDRDPMHGGWLIWLLLGLLLLMLLAAPAGQELDDFRAARTSGTRTIAPPMVVLSAVFGAGSAWTFWAQEQVGAIKGGLNLLPTLTLTFDAMLAYAGKTFVPAFMSVSYHWSAYPYVSVKGILGFLLVTSAAWIALRLAGSADTNRRLIAFGIFWWLIALVPVSNLVPTSTKMADRYLFVPTAGAILAVLAACAAYLPSRPTSRRNQWAVVTALALIAVVYAVWSHKRTEVWCGKTELRQSHPQPDLSLWKSAVEVDPDNTLALTSMGIAYLRLSPPEPDQALLHLMRALELNQANQGRIAGDKQLILTPVYDALGDGYIAKASQLDASAIGSAVWQEKKLSYANSAKYAELACVNPSGFASSDARVCGTVAEALAGEAQMETQHLAVAVPEQRASIAAERDRLRAESEEAIHRARQILSSGNVSAVDTNFRTVVLAEGNIFFGREVGVTNPEEKAVYYREALSHYQEAAELFPDDARAFLYQGLCHERLTGIAQSSEERQREFSLAEAALRKALTLTADSGDYSPSLPYRALASLYSHVGDFRSALDALKNARQADPAAADVSVLDGQIQSVEQYLAQQRKAN